MTKQFLKWVSKQEIPENELSNALKELEAGSFEANLGAHIYKKRIRFKGKGKVVAVELLFATKKMTGLFLFMAFQKMKKITYQVKNLLFSRNFQRSYWRCH